MTDATADDESTGRTTTSVVGPRHSLSAVAPVIRPVIIPLLTRGHMLLLTAWFSELIT
jgi:hypothetical protein